MSLMPALEQNTRTGPYSAVARCTRSWTASGLPTSQMTAMPPTLRGHLLGPLAVQVGDDHLGALPGEALGQRPADAVPPAGDDGAPVAEVHQNRSPPAAAAVVPSRSNALTTLRPTIQRCTSSGPSTRRCWRTSAYHAASGVSRV